MAIEQHFSESQNNSSYTSQSNYSPLFVFHFLTQSTLITKPSPKLKTQKSKLKLLKNLSVILSLHHHGYYHNRARSLITCPARARLRHHYIRRRHGKGGGGAGTRAKRILRRRAVVSGGVRWRHAAERGRRVRASSWPKGEVGPGMEQGVPASVRRGVVRWPSLLLRALRQRLVHVRLRWRVARRHRHGAAVHDRRTARVEHGYKVQDGETHLRTRRLHHFFRQRNILVLCRTQRYPTAFRRDGISHVTDRILFWSVRYSSSTTGNNFIYSYCSK